MLTVHHLGISQSDRIVWLCEELEIEYEVKRYDRDPVTRLAPPDYVALSPMGTAPVITDGEVVLGESIAIVEWLLETRGQDRLQNPPGSPARADYLFWLHFANSSLMPAAMIDMVTRRTRQENDPASTFVRRLEKAWDLVEARLGETPWLAGDEFTAADVMSVFALTTMRMFAPRDIGGYPNVKAYLQRVAQRPAFQRAMAKADPGFEVPLA